MPIDPSSRWRALPAMRLVCLMLAPALGRCAAAPGLAELEVALRTFRADPPRGWSYTQTTTAEGRSTVERYDAARPEFDRWSLRQTDGRPPDAAALRRYAETRSRRSRGGTAPQITEQLDVASAELLARDDARSTYRCRLKPPEAGDKTAAFLSATLVLHRPTATMERIELRSTGPFSPAFGVKIAELRTTLTYSVPTAEIPSLPERVVTVVRGTAFWFKSLDAEMDVVFSDYAPVRKR